MKWASPSSWVGKGSQLQELYMYVSVYTHDWIDNNSYDTVYNNCELYTTWRYTTSAITDEYDQSTKVSSVTVYIRK